ncbi:MAG: hypothetical protein IJ873_02890 [Lachnospiraceae bacterium]|nr:hypothetical protein [Lachnospiraceae bacterium]
MADNKNMELNDEMMAKATGGEDEERFREEKATVMGAFGDQSDCYRILREGCTSEDVAHYDAINIVEPGTKVKVALVGMGRWQIIEFL